MHFLHHLQHVLQEGIKKLLPYPSVHSRRYYHFEGHEFIQPHPRHVTELAGMRSYENLDKTDVILSCSEAKDLEAAAFTVEETTSWMDWWTFAAKSMALRGSEDSKMLKCLFVAGARCHVLVAKTASTLGRTVF